MAPLHPLERHLADMWDPRYWGELTVLAAVSGGADSVGLLRAMAAVRQPGSGRLMVAHYNHRWRGAASDADETFVRDLSRQLNLPCEVGRSDSVGGMAGLGHGGESAARAARYDFFRATADRVAARYVATAHTATDQAETILHRILRGTGLRGLGGIPHTAAEPADHARAAAAGDRPPRAATVPERLGDSRFGRTRPMSRCSTRVIGSGTS